MQSTNLVDYYDADEQDLDLVNYLIGEDLIGKKRSDAEIQKAAKKRRPFRSRKSYVRRVLGRQFGR